MNQQACLFVKNRDSLKGLCQQDTEKILNLSNKYRGFVFILEDHFKTLEEFENSVHLNTVLPLNELLTQFLTHTLGDQVISDPIITESITRHWIHDIDAFVAFPKSIQKKLINIGPHVYFYQDLNLQDNKR